MLCELCHKREATVHLTQQAPGIEAKELHLCESCFPAHGMSDYEQAVAAARLFKEDLPGDPEGPKQQ
jgi:protein-arginine kinase activator protein McsA